MTTRLLIPAAPATPAAPPTPAATAFFTRTLKRLGLDVGRNVPRRIGREPMSGFQGGGFAIEFLIIGQPFKGRALRTIFRAVCLVLTLPAPTAPTPAPAPATPTTPAPFARFTAPRLIPATLIRTRIAPLIRALLVPRLSAPVAPTFVASVVTLIAATFAPPFAALIVALTAARIAPALVTLAATLIAALIAALIPLPRVLARP
ncbi:MAG: hypothetical protein ACTHM6_05485, partial [Tepidisphaeraceae bacterium]